ncbi:MAG: O-acetyl-ADP-ribose deacetylase [Tenuifilaceae bacterium]|jgi:O-acetyl-ADP-ribose deacetylase (regulator of RNase III)|nr:O-acetyl-ADP-ribose deacetylase [Tenuifilaceae bacterium]
MSRVFDNIAIIRGDITLQAVDAIVNAANQSLLGGGGVDGAIHRAAGPMLLEECRKLDGCPTGEARITKGYNIPAKYIIHTVGPIWRGGHQDEATLLQSAYNSTLSLALQYKLKSIAFPNICTGIYSFPKPLAAQIAIECVHNFIQKNSHPKLVTFVCFDDENFQTYKRLLDGER